LDLGSLIATLGVDSSQLRKLDTELNNVDRKAATAFGNMGGHASSAMTSVAGLVGVTLSLAGAIALAHSALSSWYSTISSGIMKVEEFKKEMISTSYLLAAQSKVEKPDLGKAYAAWGEYYKWMKSAALEADKAAASGMEDIMAVATQLLKKGVKAKDLEEFNVIARLTDVMKGAIPGMASLAMQARGEVTAILEGVIKPGSQTAIVLAGIDSEFKKNMASARAAGKELKYFSDLLPKINQYTLDMMGTLDAVTSSLKAAYSVVQVKAFGDAHKDIVKFIGDLGNKIVENGKLTAQGEKFALALGEAWAQAKVSITEAVEYMLNNFPKIISDVSNIASGIGKIASAAAGAVPSIVKLISKLAELASNPLTYAVLGASAGAIAGGPLGAAIGGTIGLVGAAAIKTQYSLKQTTPTGIAPAEAQKNALGAANQEIMARYGITPKALEGVRAGTAAPWTPALRPPSGKEGKGGGGGSGAQESAEKSVRSFMETMSQATAQGAGDTEAVLAAWKSKQLQTLNELAAKGADISQAKLALNQAVDAKQRKIDDDFNKWYISGLENQSAVLKAEEEEKLKTVAGNEAKQAQVKEVYRRKNADLDYQVQTNTANLFKGYLDTMAQLSPTLEGQIRLKKESLDLELKLSKAALERQIDEKKITPELADQARAMEALVAQAKKFNLEMENNKGLSGWAYGRAKEADQRSPIKDMMGGLESGISDAWSQGIANAMADSKSKKSFKEMGQSIIQSMILEMNKKSWIKVWDKVADMLRPDPKKSGGLGGLSSSLGGAEDMAGLMAKASAGSVEAANKLNAASGWLTTSSTDLTGAASTTNTASQTSLASGMSLGLSAAGLGLSAIGMISGSKELVMAGTILQVAALAIEIAAAALKAAAVIESASSWIPFFHEGGPIYAHVGWPRLRSDEVPLIGQTGERMLSRSQNRDYEAGMRAVAVGGNGGGGSSVVYNPTYHINAIDARGVDAILAKHGKAMTKVINREVGRRGRKI
jgi:hypothetical protein